MLPHLITSGRLNRGVLL